MNAPEQIKTLLQPGGDHSGQPLPHESAVLHVTGEAAFTDDLPELRGTLYAALVTSPVAHGSLVGPHNGVDKAALSAHIRQSLQTQSQVTLAELLHSRPLQQGLGELVAYLQLASDSPGSVVDEATQDEVAWQVSAENSDTVLTRRARLPRIIFVRS